MWVPQEKRMEKRMEKMKVFAVVEEGGSTRWVRLGRAYLNADGSINIFLDALPLGTNKLQLRDAEEDNRSGGETNGSDAAEPEAATEVSPTSKRSSRARKE